ncbi:MAG TPA: sugar phosphate isomerase/epimerase family protein [Tepidisphaeraceae bacterium]|nr:sugar phosphate isomerase/epimerase family protein [Tepidisphaeraceae bacterium]
MSDRLAVCSWSLQPESGADLIAKVRQTGLSRVQLHLDPIAEAKPGWERAPQELRDAGIEVVSGMVACVGEDYSTIEAIHRTGGVVPDATWPATRERMRKSAALVQTLGISLVTFHAGFIPPDASDPVYGVVRDRINQCANLFKSVEATIALETGQEAATTLDGFLRALGRGDVGVNFDPANMLLYGSGDPIAALQLLLPHIRQVHLKDALPSDRPGAWGEEVPLGRGKVDWPAFFATLHHAGYNGNLVIEREAGSQRITDIHTAIEFGKAALI